MANKILMTYTDEQLQELFQPTKCAKCGQRLHESTTGMRKMGDNSCCCSACYFKAFGEGIDDYPIGIPRMHR